MNINKLKRETIIWYDPINCPHNSYFNKAYILAHSITHNLLVIGRVIPQLTRDELPFISVPLCHRRIIAVENSNFRNYFLKTDDTHNISLVGCSSLSHKQEINKFLGNIAGVINPPKYLDLPYISRYKTPEQYLEEYISKEIKK